MEGLDYCYSPILCARGVPMGRYYKATAIRTRILWFDHLHHDGYCVSW
jgi:hypothetical protein